MINGPHNLVFINQTVTYPCKFHGMVRWFWSQIQSALDAVGFWNASKHSHRLTSDPVMLISKSCTLILGMLTGDPGWLLEILTVRLGPYPAYSRMPSGNSVKSKVRHFTNLDNRRYWLLWGWWWWGWWCNWWLLFASLLLLLLVVLLPLITFMGTWWTILDGELSLRDLVLTAVTRIFDAKIDCVCRITRWRVLTGPVIWIERVTKGLVGAELLLWINGFNILGAGFHFND